MSRDARWGPAGRPAAKVRSEADVRVREVMTSSAVSAASRAVVAADGDRIRAERHAREVVADMHWRGMVVPPLYTRMAAEFQDLIASGDYAAWVASGPGTGHASRPTRRFRPISPSPI